MTGVARLGVGIELVGRQAEVAALAGALDRAVAGRPTGVLLSGDAGVGKSRLVAEAAERATALGFTVLVGRCLDTGESALPYLPFTEIVGTLAGTRPELLDEHVALRHLLPGGYPREEAPRDDRELRQLQVFDATLSALAGLTASGPALLVVEDLHWADRSSRDLLVFLLSRLTGQRLVVLATYRSDEMHRRHPLRAVLSELVRLPAVERLELAPLGPADALELVRRLAAGTLSEAVVHRAARRSEGNAFFAEELVSASSDGLPHGLAEVLVARVEGLPPAAQRVLRVASVAGRRVRHDQLAEVSGLSVDELEQSLRDAVTHHVLVAEEPSPTNRDAYVFRHELLREAIYHELLPGERSRLHAAYAALLAAQPTGTCNRAAELAHHALAGHDLPLALAASVQAADEANDQEAPAEVLQHAERAIELWSAVPDAERVAGVDEGTVTKMAAWAASATGDPDRGIALGRRALELAEQRGDPFNTSCIARRYALRLLELPGRAQEALVAARRAVDLVAEHSGEHLAWAHAVLARALIRLDRLTEAAVEARATLDATGVDPDPTSAMASAKAYALTVLATCEEYAGDAGAARARLRRAKPLARSSGNLAVELRVYYVGGMSLLDAGRLAEAAAEFAEGEARAAATGLTWSSDGLDLRVAHVIARFLRGDWDAAEAAAELAGVSVAAVVATRLSAAGMLPVVARGRFEQAEHRLAELREFASVDEQVVLFVGQAGAEAALWQGRPARAVELLDAALAALADTFSELSPPLGRIMLDALAIGAQADLLATGGTGPEEAAGAARALLADAERTARDGMPRAGTLGPEGLAWLARARAELTRATGRPDPDAWTAVLDAFGYETAPGPGGGQEPCGYRQAEARLRRAEARLATGVGHTDTDRVEADLRAALDAAEGLGADPLRDAVLAMATRAGLRLRGPAPASSGPDPLIPRERSVLALVAEGRTNRQIGQTLFISEKTVSVHLSRVMAKLGAGSRTEAVSIAFGRGLLGGRALAPSDS